MIGFPPFTTAFASEMTTLPTTVELTRMLGALGTMELTTGATTGATVIDDEVATADLLCKVIAYTLKKYVPAVTPTIVHEVVVVVAQEYEPGVEDTLYPVISDDEDAVHVMVTLLSLAVALTPVGACGGETVARVVH